MKLMMEIKTKSQKDLDKLESHLIDTLDFKESYKKYLGSNKLLIGALI